MESGKKSLRVLLVDDHTIVREGYKTLLESCGGIQIIAEAASGESACQIYNQESPDLVIMDISLPGISGLEAVRRITNRDPDARILVFSMHEDTIFVEQSLQAGASGYITKHSSVDELLMAVKNVAAGDIYLDPKLAQRIAIQKTRGKSSPFANLSTREFEVFCMLAEGNSVNEAAERLSLSYKTVANYSTQIKNKLQVTSISELTRLALRHNLVSL